MKHLKIILFVTVLAFTIGLMGCRTAPLYNVEQSPVDVSAQATLKDVRKAIITAGASLGWKMKENEPGIITGTINLRKHMAQVTIPYSKTNYSILYKDSAELQYDGTSIHQNYNGWVQNLDRAIQAGLSVL
ncbi:MAG: hypothetical protein QNJ78_01460 [Gammaproteobacteria bacterium]|nr:hypothetical protein [Gammaproteobacteria bacterium]